MYVSVSIKRHRSIGLLRFCSVYARCKNLKNVGILPGRSMILQVARIFMRSGTKLYLLQGITELPCHDLGRTLQAIGKGRYYRLPQVLYEIVLVMRMASGSLQCGGWAQTAVVKNQGDGVTENRLGGPIAFHLTISYLLLQSVNHCPPHSARICPYNHMMFPFPRVCVGGSHKS